MSPRHRKVRKWAIFKTVTKKIMGTSPKKLIQFIKFISGLLTILALGFVGYKVWLTSEQLFAAINAWKFLIVIIIGSFFYLTSNFLLAYAWHRLLSWFGETKISLKKSIAIYGRSQIAKYIPGNILHVANRHFIGWQTGISHTSLIGAATYEIIGLIIASSTLALVGLFKLDGLEAISLPGIISTLIAILFSPFMVQALLSHIGKVKIPQKTWREILKTLLPTWLIYIGFICMTGLIMWSIVYALTGTLLNFSPMIIFSVFAIAWVVGFITPGAPAGAGVREAMIILILSKLVGEETSTSTAFILRIVTILGDLGFYFVAQFIELDIGKSDNVTRT